MIDTTTFAWLTVCSALVTLIALFLIRSETGARRLARGLYLGVAIVGVVTLAVTLVRSVGMARLSALTGLPFQILLYRGGLAIGAGVGAVIVLALRALRRDRAVTPAWRAGNAFVASPDLLRMLVVSVVLSFIAVEIGKLAHDADMRQFFMQSGYPFWFHYAVMGLELLGALGLLVSTVRIPAAIGLSLLMAGAIATHSRNGDPFTDSLEAVHLLILISCIASIAATNSRAAPA
jgi:uncharacterized membrane protein YphA (DoxX/SURF4 family)